MQYLVQFAAGLGELVEHRLHEDLSQATAVYRDDSAILLNTRSRAEAVSALRYLKNAFLVVATARRGALPTAVPALGSQLGRSSLAAVAPGGGTFRTMVSLDGELVGLSPSVRTRLEATIGRQTGARVERRGGADREYWVIGRRDLDTLLLGMKLPLRKPDSTPKGALGPELSELLVGAGGMTTDDVFLDPFAGSGSLVLARLGHPAQRVIYSDLAYEQLRPDLRPRLTRNPGVTFLAEDARKLPSLADGSVDVVVTDPPWGEHEELPESYEVFAAEVARGLRRVLRPNGRLVVLVARRREVLVREALTAAGLSVSRSYGILVNGHPATVVIGHVRSLA